MAAPYKYSGYDLNVGCPSTESGGARFGAALMRRPGHVRALIDALAEAAAASGSGSGSGGATPFVSVKCRLGVVDAFTPATGTICPMPSEGVGRRDPGEGQFPFPPLPNPSSLGRRTISPLPFFTACCQMRGAGRLMGRAQMMLRRTQRGTGKPSSSPSPIPPPMPLSPPPLISLPDFLYRHRRCGGGGRRGGPAGLRAAGGL